MNKNLKTDQTVGEIRIPDHYHENDSEENKIIYALYQIGEGSAEDIGTTCLTTKQRLLLYLCCKKQASHHLQRKIQVQVLCILSMRNRKN